MLYNLILKRTQTFYFHFRKKEIINFYLFCMLIFLLFTREEMQSHFITSLF